MTFVRRAGLDVADTITDARLIAGLSIVDCIELCDISPRTWYRWLQHGAPRWAIRLILSQQGTLDRFGWKHWEIRRGALSQRTASRRSCSGMTSSTVGNAWPTGRGR